MGAHVSCGIQTLADILAHVHNTPFLEFKLGYMSCCSHDLLWSIIDCKLIINHSLNISSLPNHVIQLANPISSVKREAEIVLVEHPQKKLGRGAKHLSETVFTNIIVKLILCMTFSFLRKPKLRTS